MTTIKTGSSFKWSLRYVKVKDKLKGVVSETTMVYGQENLPRLEGVSPTVFKLPPYPK